MTSEAPAASGDVPAPAARGAFSRRRAAIGGLALTLLTLVAYQPVLTDRGGFEFLNVDDERYVVANPQVTAGLTRAGLRWALTSLHDSNWHPLTWMSLQLDAQIHGVSPWGFHLTNVVLHVINTVLLFLVLYRTTEGWGRSVTVAGLFAVHPLHVESVAWVVERKDVLSTLFFLLSMGAYAAYAARPGWLRYAAVALCFALALMAKSMVVTLPGVLLLLDAWPLGRLRSFAQADGPPRCPPAGWPRLLAEKVPLLALAAACAAVTLQAQTRMMQTMDTLPAVIRAGNALVYYVTYLARMLWPADLVVFHPNPRVSIGWAPTLLAGLLLAVVTLAAARARRAHPYLLVGWLWFLGTLVPVIGLVQVGYLCTTDHYTYVSLIGIFVMLAWGGQALLSRSRWGSSRAAPAVVVGATLGACVLLTRHQIDYWRNSVVLWQHVVDVGPESATAQAFLGRSLEARGRLTEAEPHYARAAELDTTWKRHLAEGLSLERKGDLWGARRELEVVILAVPHEETALRHLAALFLRRGELRDARRHYATLARLWPDDAGGQTALGAVLCAQGEPDAARQRWLHALEIDPAHEEARRDLDRLSADGGCPPGSGAGE